MKASFILTIVYGTDYGIALFITSIVSLVETLHSSSSESQTSPTCKLTARNDESANSTSLSQTETTHLSIETADENEDIAQDAGATHTVDSTEAEVSDSKCCKCVSFMTLWFKSMWTKKQIYFAALSHIFDQATDIGVIMEYYDEWQQPSNPNSPTNPMWFFFASVIIVCLQRIISSAVIYSLTKSVKSTLLQFMDVLLLKAIWVNYKLGLDSPCNPQRYIELLVEYIHTVCLMKTHSFYAHFAQEATFESAPQLLLSVGYILRNEDCAPWIVVASSVFSLWTLTTKVAADDLFDESDEIEKKWKELDPRCSFPFCNYQWLFRVICWRFMEISSRICLLVLIWVNLGGVALSIILSVELVACILLCIVDRCADPMGNMMYIVMAGDYANLFVIYRLLSFYVYITLVSIFASVKFESITVPKFADRHFATFERDFGLFCFVWTWFAGFISHWSFMRIDEMLGIKRLRIGERDLITYLRNGQMKEARELLAFGAKPSNDAKGCVNDDATGLVQKWCHYVNAKDHNGRTPLHYWAQYNSSCAVGELLLENGADVDAKDDDGRTPIIYCAINRKEEMIKFLIEQGADTTLEDKYDKKLLDYCKDYGLTNEHIIRSKIKMNRK